MEGKWRGIVGKVVEEATKCICTALCPVLLVSLLPLTQQSQSSIYLCLSDSLYIWEVCLLFSYIFVKKKHAQEIRSDVRQLVWGALERIWFFCGWDVVKEDWGHTSSEKATNTKVGQNNQGLAVNRMKLKPLNVVLGSVWVCGLNPLILIIILHQRSNEGWDGKTGIERLGAA